MKEEFWHADRENMQVIFPPVYAYMASYTSIL